MVAPTLNAYEYQYTDTGILLNNSATLPFIDITGVKGLDIPTIESSQSEYDSRHGGYVYALYSNIRTIVLDGVLYATPSTIDATLETLNDNFLPREDDQPFYYKGAGIAQRYIMCKPVGFNYDINATRGYGACAIQIQLQAGDVTKYVDKTSFNITSGTSTSTTNTGKTTTYPVIELVGAATETSVVKVATGETVTVTYTTDIDDFIELDFNTRTCRINDLPGSNSLTSTEFWGLAPGISTAIAVVSTGTERMVNGDCELAFGAGYSVGANWQGYEQYSSVKRNGLYSLRMRRRNRTSANGNVYIPTGLTSQAAGTYTASLWVRGTMQYINISVLNGASTVASIALATVKSNAWTKLTMPFVLSSTSGDIRFLISDLNSPSKYIKKNKDLYIDDLSIKQVNTSDVTATVYAKDGWL